MSEMWSDWVDEPSELAGQPESGEVQSVGLRRRAILKGLAGLGIGSVTFRRAMAAQAAQAGRVTPEMIKQAEWIAGVDFTDDERSSTARSVEQSLRSFGELRTVDVGYDVPPALTFFPVPPRPAAAIQRNRATPVPGITPRRPGSDEELAFLPVAELSALLRSRQVSSTELTRLYLDRLKRFDPLLKCVVTFTEEVALKQAAQADREIAAGQYRGPLARDPLGGQGPDRLSGLSDDLGCDAVQGPGDRREGQRRGTAGGGRRGAAGQALAGRAGDGRPVVRRPDAQPLGPTDRLERFVGGLGVGCRGRAWSASQSAARRSAASSHPAAPAEHRVCGRPSDASAATAA